MTCYCEPATAFVHIVARGAARHKTQNLQQRAPLQPGSLSRALSGHLLSLFISALGCTMRAIAPAEGTATATIPEATAGSHGHSPWPRLLVHGPHRRHRQWRATWRCVPQLETTGPCFSRERVCVAGVPSNTLDDAGHPRVLERGRRMMGHWPQYGTSCSRFGRRETKIACIIWGKLSYNTFASNSRGPRIQLSFELRVQGTRPHRALNGITARFPLRATIFGAPSCTRVMSIVQTRS